MNPLDLLKFKLKADKQLHLSEFESELLIKYLEELEKNIEAKDGLIKICLDKLKYSY